MIWRGPARMLVPIHLGTNVVVPTWSLVKILGWLSHFVSQIMDCIYWTVLISPWLRHSENQQFLKVESALEQKSILTNQRRCYRWEK